MRSEAPDMLVGPTTSARHAADDRAAGSGDPPDPADTPADTAGPGTADAVDQDDATVRHAAVLAVYGAVVTAAVTAGRLAGVRLPERIGLGDTVLIAIATHKASRLLSKNTVTGPVRAPFTRTEAPAAMSEVNESPRGHGVRHTIGELLTCPFCVGVWTASALTAGLVLAPRPTRLVATALTAVFTSDVLHLAYDTAKRRATQ